MMAVRWSHTHGSINAISDCDPGLRRHAPEGEDNDFASGLEYAFAQIVA